MEISIQALQIQGEAAIQAGIDTSLIGGSATVYSNQQVYIRDLNNNQTLGTFDRLAAFSSQRWAFNYLTSVESPIIGLFNITTAFYAAEYSQMTYQQVNDSVRGMIDGTKS